MKLTDLPLSSRVTWPGAEVAKILEASKVITAPWQSMPILRHMEELRRLTEIDLYGKHLADIKASHEAMLRDALGPSSMAAMAATYAKSYDFRSIIDENAASIARYRDELLAPMKAASEHMAWLNNMESAATLHARNLVDWEQKLPSVSALISKDTLERLGRAAEAVNRRVEAHIEAGERLSATTATMREALTRADLADVRSIVADATSQISEALATAIQKGPRKGRLHTTFAAFAIVWQIWVAVLSVVGQPLFQRWLDAHYPTAEHKTSSQSLSLQSLAQLAVVTSDATYVRTGPHTQQRYLGIAQRGDVVRILRRKGRWTLIRVVPKNLEGTEFSGWVKTGQVASLMEQAAVLLDEHHDIAGVHEPSEP